MILALYMGRALWPSRVIEFINWSPYSHAAGINETTGECVEAWSGGVRLSPNFSTLHTDGTRVDFFRVIRADEAQRRDAWDFCLSQKGKGYDYWGVAHFITRRNTDDQDKWFCSELFFEGWKRAGLDLLKRIESHKVYPGMLALSTELEYMGTLKTNKAEGATLPSEGG